MSQYLFLFTIGPVQSFIAQARKTQDLYSGSKLLSDLIEKTMNKLKEQVQSPEFIFPNEDIKFKPNRFVATIETDNIEEIGKELKDFVETEFEKIAENALDSMNLTYEKKFSESFWKQIEDFLKIYWVALPLNDDYPQVYRELENNLGAIKNVRNFNQLEETGRKCSLCGERNVLFYKKTLKNKKPKYIQESAIRINKNELNSGEGLCAVCFTKRFYKTSVFPSTAEIAAMDWLKKIPDEEKNEYKKLFNNFDEQLYYEENLRQEYLKKYGNYKGEGSLAEAKKKLKSYYKNGKPPRYYALLMLDGDNMGKWLSGEFLEDKEKKNLKDFHKIMSKKLGGYANKASNIIQEPKGKLVYAGGDDVLAFVNLNHLLPVMNDLRKEFPKFEELEFKFRSGYKSSASAGIVIAHYKTPLSEVLKWARNMEKDAKEEAGRNAFAIAVLKHSGETSKTIWKWDLDDSGLSKKIELLGELFKELQDDKRGFSNTFIKNLIVEFLKLNEIEDKWIKVELKRLLERASQIKGDEEKKNSKVKSWQNELYNLYIDSPLIMKDKSKKDKSNKDNFTSFLNITDFLARRIK